MDTAVDAEQSRENLAILQAIDKCLRLTDNENEWNRWRASRLVTAVLDGMKGQDALREDERILQAIDKSATSRDDQYEINKGILKEILNNIFGTMKVRDALFRQLYDHFFFVENYAKGARVGGEEEFHVNMSIVIPLNYNLIGLPHGKPGYRKLRFSNKTSVYTPEWDKYRSVLLPWLTEETSKQFLYIDKDAFLRSIESLLKQAMLNVPVIDNYTVKVCKNGSPITLCVNKQGFPQMNVTLVPVINMSKLRLHSLRENNWYAVPEILQNVEDEHLQWRLAFYNHEDELLKYHSYIKPVIRLIEKLRDIQQWNVIPCYHIKTLFMRYALNVGHSGFICTFTGIKLVIHILHELRKVCKSRYLEDCWDPAHNLVDADVDQLAVIAEQLTVIIEEITDDPAKLADWVFTPEEMVVYQNELNAVGNAENTDDPSQST